MAQRTFSEVRLVNGSAGDPVLYIDYPGSDDAILFDAGDLARLAPERLADLEAVFLTHHHVDHFMDLDRIIRSNLDSDKTLHVFGPAGTIRKVYDRIKSYEYQFFPFQNVVVKVHDLAPGVIREALLECKRKFPEPDVTEREWGNVVVYENDDWRVEAAGADHTVACYSYALIERGGYHPDPRKLEKGLLRPGAWVEETLKRLRAGEPHDSILEIAGGHFGLADLAKQYFVESPGSKVVFVTDTEWNDVTGPRLTNLAKGAWRLYCDSYYAAAQAKPAAKHKHMTAAHAAELAKAAKVDELILMHFGRRYAGRYDALTREAAAVFPKAKAELP